MSLIALWGAAAWAGTAVWLSGAPDPAATPGHLPVAVSALGPSPAFGPADEAAVQALLDERARCALLLDEFDGELAILRRLDVALDAVTLLRPADADAVWTALLLQGLAVQRYFPALDGVEAARAGVARTAGGRAENRPWADAIALLPDRLPTAAELGDEAARLAFQEQRARALILPPGRVAVAPLPPGAVVRLAGGSGGGAAVLPGEHRVAVEVDGQVRLRAVIEVPPGEVVTVPYVATAEELAALAPTLASAQGPVPLGPAAAARLGALDGPVLLVVEGRRGPRVFEVQGEVAAPQAGADAPSGGPSAWVGLGGAWVYDGDYLLQNAAAGAPATAQTVNALAPVVLLGGELALGPVSAGLGVDLLLPLGAHHTLPSGDRELRLRAHPHLGLGAGPLRATVGWWTPWHLGLGLRGALPLGSTVELTGAYVHGLGIARPRDAGPAFEPGQGRVGWVGVQARR